MCSLCLSPAAVPAPHSQPKFVTPEQDLTQEGKQRRSESSSLSFPIPPTLQFGGCDPSPLLSAHSDEQWLMVMFTSFWHPCGFHPRFVSPAFFYPSLPADHPCY